MNSKNRIFITGGAGFIGTNLAVSYLRDGYPVTLLDNFSRPGVEANARWLRERFPKGLVHYAGIIREICRQVPDIITFFVEEGNIAPQNCLEHLRSECGTDFFS